MDDAKKAAHETLNGLAGKAKKAGRFAATAAQGGAEKFADIAQQANRKRQLAKYSPVFPEEFFSGDFDLPAMVVIEDEDTRKDIEVCKGSIGWLGKEGGMEVLHLYEEAVPESGLTLCPTAVCDAAYYLDKVGGGRFIDLCQYFEVIQKDKMTELRNVAYSLGAKECRLEAWEEEKSLKVSKKKGAGKAKVKAVPGIVDSVSASAEAASDEQSTRRSSVVFVQRFEGSEEVVRPELHWYRNDKELNSLIEMRCSGRNPMKEYSVQLDSMASSSISISRAAKIDAAVKKIGAVANFSFEGEAKSELRKKLVFEITF